MVVNYFYIFNTIDGFIVYFFFKTGSQFLIHTMWNILLNTQVVELEHSGPNTILLMK